MSSSELELRQPASKRRHMFHRFYHGDNGVDSDDSGDGADGGGDGGDSGDEIPLEKYLPSSNLLPRWFSS